MIDADSVLNGIEELKKSPWFNRGKEIVKGDPGFQHVGYIERKEAVEVVRDLCIRKEPTAVGWISVKDRLPEPTQPDEYLVVNWDKVETAIFLDGMWITPRRVQIITHWMPMPEPPKEEEQNA